MGVTAAVAAVAAVAATTTYTTYQQKRSEDKANRRADDAKLAAERENQSLLEEDKRASIQDAQNQQRDADQARRRAMASYDRSQTILTGPQGLGNVGSSQGASKTLLGS